MLGRQGKKALPHLSTYSDQGLKNAYFLQRLASIVTSNKKEDYLWKEEWVWATSSHAMIALQAPDFSMATFWTFFTFCEAEMSSPVSIFCKSMDASCVGEDKTE